MDDGLAAVRLDGAAGRPAGGMADAAKDGASKAGDSSKVAFAHALRGWAAVSVVVSHLAVNFWQLPAVIGALIALPMPDPMPAAPAVTRAIVAATEAVPGATTRFGFGPFGVALFFLISGFVIPFSFRRQSRAGFLAGRALRLWPTYAAGLTVTLLALAAGAWLEEKPFPYGAAHVATHYVLGLRDLLWLPSIDGIVWTLEIEIKFYLLCACLAPWLRDGKVRVFYVLAPAAAGLILALGTRYEDWAAQHPTRFALAWVATVDSQMILFMLIGTAFHYLYRGWIGPRHAAALAVGLGALFSALAFEGYARQTAAKAAVSYSLALAVFAACYALRRRFRGGGVSGWLADVSYPLYAVHGVGGYVLMNLLVRHGVTAEATLAIAAAAALLLAWGIHVAVEKPTHRLATRVARALSPAPATPPAESAAGRARPVSRAA